MSVIDQATLRRLYVDEERSIRSIAALLHVAPRTVYDALIRGRIPRRQTWQHSNRSASSDRTPFDEATLRQLYLVEQLSVREIAARFHVFHSVIYNALVRWNIPRRRPGPRCKDTSHTS